MVMSLPPRVTGSPRAVLEVGVTEVALHRGSSGAAAVLVDWWGSRSPQIVVPEGHTAGCVKYQVNW